MAYDPCVFARLLAGFRIVEDVADPFACLGSAQDVVAIEIAGNVDAQSRVPPDHFGVVVRDRVSISADYEDVPLPVYVFG
jgi:hypothetical protein